MKKEIRRSFTCLILCFFMVMSGMVFIPEAAASSGRTQGSCGENVEWNLDTSTGQLTISGEGSMDDFGDGDMAPWFDVRGQIKSAVIGREVAGITAAAFLGCCELESFAVEEGSAAYSCENGVLFSSDGLSLVCYPAGKTDTRYSLPEGTHRIEDMAFELCSDLEYAALPESVTSIGRDAFANCISLKKVNLPDSVTDADTGIFYGCDQLKTVNIGIGLASLPEDTFRRCSGLKQVLIPDSVKEIGAGAFAECCGLRKIILPDSVTGIGEGAFEGCGCLTDILYCGSQDQWQAVDRDSGNDALENAALSCDQTQPAGLYEYMYQDLSSDDWYYDWVVYTLDSNIMQGTGDNTFSPEGQLTRAEMVRILYNCREEAAGSEAAEDAASATGFSDVKSGAWYEKAVAWASSKGLVKGLSDT